ncbi:MAG: hypothetical protein AAF092_04985 [Pseudomonadota bacterium]
MQNSKAFARSLFIGLGLALAATQTHAATFFGGTPGYFSQADIPFGLYATGPTFLEDFEDASLDGGITASTTQGNLFVTGGSNNTDSVDGDDGSIDGFGRGGRSYFNNIGNAGITFTFANPVTAAGVVFTDGSAFLNFVTFSAFDGNGSQIFTSTFPGIGDNSFAGTTAEDTFFGISDANGIGSIFISSRAGAGIEVDHVQYGDMAAAPVPLPATLPMLLAALGLGAVIRKRSGGTAARTPA